MSVSLPVPRPSQAVLPGRPSPDVPGRPPLVLRLVVSVLLLASRPPAAGQLESEYSFFEPGTPLLRSFELLEKRPHVMITCTASTVIAELEYRLVPLVPEPDSVDPPVVYRLSDEHGNEDRVAGHCPTLRRCLGRRACVFLFSNEFCGQDPFPGRRKKMLVLASCFEDANYPHAAVVHLQYRSLLEAGVRNYSAVKMVEQEEPADLVFGLTCPRGEQAVSEAGYHGLCSGHSTDPDRLRERAGFIMATTHSDQCRQQMRQVLCALAYSASAECLPPFIWQAGRLSHLVTPSVGSRPAEPTHPDLHHPSLVSVKLGFYILVHSGLDAVLELLSLLYEPAHLYVLHVDRRSEKLHGQLGAALNSRYPDRGRVRLLSLDRSFATDWGSDKILRAELECLEELLRMGPWDFAVPLSGRDLPLRPAADMAATLAPYRGRNLLHPGEQKFDRPGEQDRVFAMYGCDGFVFNVSRPGDSRLELKLPIYGHSMWKVLDRRFVSHIISEVPHSELGRRWSLLLRIITIPDESFFGTLLMNSEYSDTLLRAKLHHPKRFEGENSDRLCRHRDVVEFCGKGPATIDERDIGHLQRLSARFFVARKFSPETDDTARQRYRDAFSRPYHETVRHVLTPWLTRHMVRISLKWMQISDDFRGDEVTWKEIQIVPRLEPVSQCCVVLHRRENQAVLAYAYIVDFAAAGRRYRSRVLVAPPVGCFPAGHLRSVRVVSDPPLDPAWFGARLNPPVPYLRAGPTALLAELWFHQPDRWTAEQYSDCDAQPHRDTVVFPGLSVVDGTAERPVRLRIELWEGHTLRCSRQQLVHWSSPAGEPRPGRPERPRQELNMVVNVTLSCGNLSPGRRTLRLYDDEAADPHWYELPLLFVSWYVEPEGSTADFWQVEDAAPLEELYPAVPADAAPLEELSPATAADARAEAWSGSDEL